MALLALTACDDGGPSRTIVPTEMPFAEMFRLVRVVTPEQSPESPIALISGARWDGDRIAIADASARGSGGPNRHWACTRPTALS